MNSRLYHLTISDYRRILSDCERIKNGYPEGHSQIPKIMGQIERLKASIDYLEKREN